MSANMQGNTMGGLAAWLILAIMALTTAEGAHAAGYLAGRCVGLARSLRETLAFWATIGSLKARLVLHRASRLRWRLKMKLLLAVIRANTLRWYLRKARLIARRRMRQRLQGLGLAPQRMPRAARPRAARPHEEREYV